MTQPAVERADVPAIPPAVAPTTEPAISTVIAPTSAPTTAPATQPAAIGSLTVLNQPGATEQGRVAMFELELLDANREPLMGARVLSYVDGVRWGPIAVTDKAGRAVSRVPMRSAGAARVRFDVATFGGNDSPGAVSQANAERWIWAAEQLPDQAVTFQRDVQLDTVPRSATLHVAVDNSATVLINGTAAVEQDGWEPVKPTDVTSLLRAGANRIEVRALNKGGPASLIARLEIERADGSRLVVPSDASWLVDGPQTTPATELAAADAHIVRPAPWPGLSRAKSSYNNGPAIDIESPWLSNEITVQVTPPAPAGSLPPVTWDVMADTWVGTDALGRPLPTFEEVGPPRAGKTVGLFYYVWHEHFSRVAIPRSEPILVVPDIVRRNPEDPPFGEGTHHWSEPLFGFYNNSDEYVQRKHTQMLADAGVDVLVYDTSNNLGYLDQWLLHADMLRRVRESGQAAPQVAHLSWASTDGGVLGDLIRDFYDPGLYRDLWFQWKGKPLLLANVAQLPPELNQLADRFTLRTSWAWTDPNGWFGDGKDKWPWLAEVPYTINWHEEKGRAEQASVTAGHHPTTLKGKSMSKGVQPPRDQERSGEGIQFAEQFDYALKLDPEFLFITQWNEWTAGAMTNDRDGMPYPGRTLRKGQRYFVDVYDPEFNRDVEPMAGGYGDNYYYQMVAGIRRYKGVRPIEPVKPAGAIAIDGKFDDWTPVAPEFRDTLGDPAQRDAWSWGWVHHYVNTTGRNDLASAKVSFDDATVSFCIRTHGKRVGNDLPILYIDADNDPKTGWLGYDLAINRTAPGSIETNVDGADAWKSAADTATAASGEDGVELTLPRKLVRDTFDFKWADGCHQYGDWRDFALNGDAAPNGRFNYRAKLTPRAAK